MRWFFGIPSEDVEKQVFRKGDISTLWRSLPFAANRRERK